MRGIEKTFLLSIALLAFSVSVHAQQNQIPENVAKQIIDQMLGDCPIDAAPATQSAPVEVVIGTEDHLKTDEKKNAQQIEEAGRGDYFLCLDGYDFEGSDTAERMQRQYGIDASKSLIRGLEEPFSNALVGSARELVYLKRGLAGDPQFASRVNLTKMNMLLSFVDDPYSREAWAAVPRPRLDPKQEELAKFVDKLIPMAGSRADWTKALKGIQSTELWKNSDLYLELGKMKAEAMGQLAETKYKESKKVPNLASFYNLISSPMNRFAEDRFVSEVAIPWRDNFWVENLKLIVDQAQAAGKPLRLRMGGDHPEDLVAKMQRVFGDRVKVRIE